MSRTSRSALWLLCAGVNAVSVCADCITGRYSPWTLCHVVGVFCALDLLKGELDLLKGEIEAAKKGGA